MIGFRKAERQLENPPYMINMEGSEVFGSKFRCGELDEILPEDFAGWVLGY